MIEAVGWQYFEEFFRRCSDLLAPDGLMLLQAITIDDRLYESEKGARSFANTHIFPGGCLPSAALIAGCIAGQTDMRPIWAEDMTPHYPLTLAAWRERFLAAWDGLAGRGYDERFKRLWVFYLSSSEAGFRERRLGDLQLLYAKPEWRGDESAGEVERSRGAAGVERPVALDRLAGGHRLDAHPAALQRLDDRGVGDEAALGAATENEPLG
jgi:cyclopropane-fatty-acyl-phospholipid synthase